MAEKKKSEKTSSPEAPKISRKRLWAFRVIALIVVPLVFFCGLEFVLRLFGVGYPASVAIPDNLNGRSVYCNNTQFTWRFFPHNIARDLYGFVFDAEKPPGTYRIFVMGASAVYGVPEPAYNFGRILEVMLNQRYPQTHFEVITTAAAAINSHAVLEIAKDCANYDPDLFIVYLGNNEVVGPFGPGTVFSSMSPSLSLIRANIAFKSTRIGQLAEQIISLVTSCGSDIERWEGMAMFLGNQVRYDSPDLELVYIFFEQNLNDICRAAQRAGADVIISNVGCNLKDCPPFASLHKETLSDSENQKWQQLYQQGIDNENSGEFDQAVENYLAAAEIDPMFADLQFRMGRCYWNTDQYETAREHYIKAREYDTLRFRADDGVNRAVRSAAQGKTDKGIYFADSVDAIEENSPHNTPGEELFYEHVHLNFTGNYVVAKTLLNKIHDILPDRMKQNPGPVLTEEQCAERLIYTPIDRCFLLGIIDSMASNPPFTNQLYHDEFVQKTKQKIRDLNKYLQPSEVKKTVRLYEQAIRQNPDDWQLRWRYSQILGILPQFINVAEVQLEKIIELCPYETTSYLYLGQNLYKQGNYYEALTIMQKLLEIKPNSSQAHLELGKIHLALKNYKKAVFHLKASLSIQSSQSIEIFINLAEAYFFSGHADKAIDTLYKTIKNFPKEKTARVHAYLGHILETQGEYKKALEESKLAVEIDPETVKQKGFREHIKRLQEKVEP